MVSQSVNVVYLVGSNIFIFSRKFSKTASGARCRKIPENNATSKDTKTLLFNTAEGSKRF